MQTCCIRLGPTIKITFIIQVFIVIINKPFASQLQSQSNLSADRLQTNLLANKNKREEVTSAPQVILLRLNILIPISQVFSYHRKMYQFLLPINKQCLFSSLGFKLTTCSISQEIIATLYLLVF